MDLEARARGNAPRKTPHWRPILKAIFPYLATLLIIVCLVVLLRNIIPLSSLKDKWQLLWKYTPASPSPGPASFPPAPSPTPAFAPPPPPSPPPPPPPAPEPEFLEAMRKSPKRAH